MSERDLKYLVQIGQISSSTQPTQERTSAWEIIKKFKEESNKVSLLDLRAKPEIKVPKLKRRKANETKDDIIADLREELHAARNPTDGRPFKMEFQGQNLEYEQVMQSLRDEIRAEDRKFDELVEIVKFTDRNRY